MPKNAVTLVGESGPRHRFGRPRVLCVDDNKDLCDSLAERLELRGVEVQVAYDGNSAIDILLERGPDWFNLVILDMWLCRSRSEEDPSADPRRGLAIVKQYSLIAADTPILILTNYARFDDCVACIRAGAVDYLPKYDPIEKVDNLRDVIFGRCESILFPRVQDDHVGWFRHALDDLIEAAPGRFAAVFDAEPAALAGIPMIKIHDKRVLVGDSLREVQMESVQNTVLRWLNAYLVEIPRRR